MKRRALRRINILLFLLGALFFACAITLTVINTFDDANAKTVSENTVNKLIDIIPGRTEKLTDAVTVVPDNEVQQISDMRLEQARRFFIQKTKQPTIEIDGESYVGILSVPSLGITLPVMKDWSYPKLKISPCIFFGSVYKGNAVIAAHNYKSHFRNINTLSRNDSVLFTDVEGNVFGYRVIFVEMLPPAAVGSLTSGEFELTLFTCTVGGKNRYVVRCSLQYIKRSDTV